MDAFFVFPPIFFCFSLCVLQKSLSLHRVIISFAIVIMKRKIRFNSTIKKRTILKASDYCLDISKLILGGVVLAAVIDMGINEGALFLIGLVIVISFAAIGFFLYILGNQNKL